MTIFGNRDSSYGSSIPVADPAPLAAGTATPTIPARAFGAPDNRRVILRVHGDESIVVGSVVEVAPWSRIPEARALVVPRDV